MRNGDVVAKEVVVDDEPGLMVVLARAPYRLAGRILLAHLHFPERLGRVDDVSYAAVERRGKNFRIEIVRRPLGFLESLEVLLEFKNSRWNFVLLL